MTIVQSMPTGFKTGLLSCAHNFSPSNRAVILNTPDVFYIALYTSSAALDNTTTVYSATNEITNTSGTAYVAGGIALTISTTPTGDTAQNAGYISFSPAVWTVADFTARGALIYNYTNGGPAAGLAVAVLDFGSDKTVSGGGTFTVTFPTYASGITVAAVQLS
jgi:hypothetical protein